MALTNKLTAIGNAVRSKTGGSSLLSLDDMATAISNIPTGGGGFDYSGLSGLKFAADTDSVIDVSDLDTSGFTTMKYMFYQCSNVTSLDLSGFDTSNVTDMTYMFYQAGLTSLDVSSFDCQNVDKFQNTFGYLKNLTSLDLSDIKAYSPTVLSSMFAYSEMTSLNLSGLHCDNVTSYNSMFSNSIIESVYFPNYSRESGYGSAAATTDYMFNNADITHLIIATNKSSVQTLASSYAFNNNHVSNVYVPDALLSQYQQTTNWSFLGSKVKALSTLPQKYKTLYGIQ